MKKLKLACIGCGGRGWGYMELAGMMPERYVVVGGADPRANRVQRVQRASNNPEFRGFPGADEILAVPKFADVMIIGTQDAYHREPAIAAMKKGYDLLLEKPIAQNLSEVLEIEAVARKYKRRVLVCHVLRYTPFYRKVKSIIDSGRLGRIISLNALEGVGDFHQSHSFVRGHWGVTKKSTPMIIAKSCHDMDIISWLMNEPCRRVGSFGALSYFTAANAPAGAPARCTDGCPAAATCRYNALRYLNSERGWVQYVFDGEINKLGSGGATQAEILEWLKVSPWGRCVYRCDNTAVDHQVVNMEFASAATATFTMTAFAEGRSLEVFGTKAALRGGEAVKRLSGCDIVIQDHNGAHEERITVNPAAGGYGGHMGGDGGLMLDLYDEMMKRQPEDMTSSIHRSVESHLMGFAAEAARLSHQTVELAAFRKQAK